ncbi:MAG TPA: oligosaccharide flippase family protein [Terriglobia bacterium]|nr:oligosaccharide flippase family protein [Terriglobia bacterium]
MLARGFLSLQALTRQSAVNMAGGLISQALKFCVVIYVARQFSVPEFGSFSFAWAVYAYIFVVSNFGLPMFGSRAVAQSGGVSPELAIEICWSRACLALLATVVTVAILALVPGVSRTELQLVGIFGMSNVAQAGLLDWAFQGLHHQEISAILNVLWQGSWLALAVLSVRLGLGLQGVAMALFGSALIASTVGYFWLKQATTFQLGTNGTRRLLRRSWEILRSAAAIGWGTLMVTLIVWGDVVLVRAIRGGKAVGLYAAGNRAALALAMLACMYVQGAFPLLSRMSAEGAAQFSRYFQRCYQDMALCFLPGSLWGVFYARQIVLAVFKRTEYLSAVPVFRVFQVAFLLTALWNLYGTGVVIAFHRDRDYQKVLALTAALFLPLCSVLTAFHGIQGAGVAVLLTHAFCLLAFMAKSRGFVHVNHRATLLAPFLIGLGVVAGSRVLGLTLLPSAGLLTLAYAGIMVVRFRGSYLTARAFQP